MSNVKSIALIIAEAFKRGNKLLICGNGGSAAEADHFAAELVGAFNNPNRRALPALALSSNGAIITSLGNDRGYRQVFARQVEAFGKRGDLLMVITTSDATNGHTSNLLEALKTARMICLDTVGLVSKTRTKRLLKYLDYPIIVSGKDTPTIQERQIKVIHKLCDIIEKEFST